MTTPEIKSNFHRLNDSIDNTALLMQFYDLMSRKKNLKDGVLISRLSQPELEELMLAEEESEIYSNLVSNEEMKKKHNKWLTK